MSASEQPTPTLEPLSISPEERLDFVKIVYREIFQYARHYDAHIWQIPSVTIAVNAFLISQAFSAGLLGEAWVRALVVLSASIFTFVLLIALIKHRLHKSAQDFNLKKIEIYMGLEAGLHKLYNFKDKKVLEPHVEELPNTNLPTLRSIEIDFRPNRIEKILRRETAHGWLMSVMAITFIVDLVIFVGIVCGKW